jgi:hypothetical protein
VADEFVLPGGKRAVVVRMATAHFVLVGDAERKLNTYSVMKALPMFTIGNARALAMKLQRRLFEWFEASAA